MSCYLILLEVSLFYFEIENVGLEPLLCVPNAACFSLHHILSNPSGNRTRASGATVRCTSRYTMELYLHADRPIPARIIFLISLSSAALDVDLINGNDIVYRNAEH